MNLDEETTPQHYNNYDQDQSPVTKSNIRPLDQDELDEYQYEEDDNLLSYQNMKQKRYITIELENILELPNESGSECDYASGGDNNSNDEF